MHPIVAEIRANPNLINRLVEAFRHEGRPLSPQAIYAWGNLAKGVPPSRVATVARVMGRKRHDIRPDIFPPPTRRPDALSL
jgi:hypothetical protein